MKKPPAIKLSVILGVGGIAIASMSFLPASSSFDPINEVLDIVNVNPAVEEPADEQPPVDEDPVDEQPPGVEDPVDEQPPVDEDPVDEDPVDEQPPGVEKPADDPPVDEEPVAA